ncbi:MAG TPA: crosslink repair DNA glycosylase YcaQ family protein, partial [Anaerolineales bacterium]|nr:crosslink repair DNA glycosylase YcaQ family protein [Anaerolineales bacterium]
MLRPTWHFVAPADIRWVLALTAPRVQAVNAYMYRKLEMDNALFKRSNTALTKALRGGKELTRVELASALQQAGIPTVGELRMGYIMMRAELDAVVCSGARRGKQYTYALLEERVPPVKKLDRDEAL